MLTFISEATPVGIFLQDMIWKGFLPPRCLLVGGEHAPNMYSHSEKPVKTQVTCYSTSAA